MPNISKITQSVFGESRMAATERLFFALAVSGLTWIVHRQWRNWKEKRKRKDLEEDLTKSLRTVRDLERKLMLLEATDLKLDLNPGDEIRVFMDGAFDLFHYGHMNALRLSRSLGTHLIVGVNDGKSICENKGPPILSDAERLGIVKGCRWVDDVVEHVPYVMTDEYLDYIIDKYDIDYIVHGDDPCIVDGKDCYEAAKKRGKYLEIPRTEGISTTDLVGRMLLMTKSHHSRAAPSTPYTKQRSNSTSVGSVLLMGAGDNSDSDMDDGDGTLDDLEGRSTVHGDESFDFPSSHSSTHSRSNFLTTSSKIRLFGAGIKPPQPGAKVVYLAGSWDMFNAGHVRMLELARSFGDYVIAGIHSDAVANKYGGSNFPIMNLNERVLSVLGCRYVDDVLIDAPFVVSKEMIKHLNIVKICVSDIIREDIISEDYTLINAYSIAEESEGLIENIDISEEFLSVNEIVKRIGGERTRLEQRVKQKKAIEDKFFADK